MQGFSTIGLATLAVLSALPAPDARADDPAPLVAAEIEVRPGDSLGKIAKRHGVSLEELRRWNAKRIGQGDLIRVGDKLVVMMPPALVPDEPKGKYTAHYDVKRGDSLGKIAKKLGVTVAELRYWNGIGEDGIIRVGQLLRYERRGERPDASSVGRPTRGRLRYGVHLGEGKGYRLRFPKNAYTTQAVARTLKRCTARMPQRFPGTADVLIGDISKPTGGYFPPHVSHQSGRDVDYGYYIVGNEQNKTMYRLRADQVDYDKTWELTLCMLAEDDVVRIFMDTKMQKKMVAYLRATGRLDDDAIDRLFEVYGDVADGALIRHAPAHDTHIHIRFACEPGDADCAEDTGEAVFQF